MNKNYLQLNNVKLVKLVDSKRRIDLVPLIAIKEIVLEDKAPCQRQIYKLNLKSKKEYFAIIS